jgi:hypothetical protein
VTCSGSQWPLLVSGRRLGPLCLLGVVGFACATWRKSILQVPCRIRYGCLSVFVVVAFVGGVSVSVVDVVQMVAVEDGGVAASPAVHVDVLLGRLVPR